MTGSCVRNALSAAAIAAVALIANCSVEPIDLTGKKCPCTEGWVCNASTNRCVELKKDGGPDGSKGGAGGSVASGGSWASGGTKGGTGGATGATGGIVSGGGGIAGLGGVAGGGVAGVSGTGGLGGSAGSTGCPAGQKLCSGSCVTTDAAHGCAAASCSPCPSGPNSTAGCYSTGTCRLICDTGFANCDFQSSTGCEVNISIDDPAHCGNCSNKCTATHATTATCSSGKCVFTCDAGYVDCNSSGSDGCEALLSSDKYNCGKCGSSCAALGGGNGFECVNSGCSCTEQSDCADDNGVTYPDAQCVSGTCKCSVTTCHRGEACIKSGPSAICSCRGGAACLSGQICCSSGCVTGTTC